MRRTRGSPRKWRESLNGYLFILPALLLLLAFQLGPMLYNFYISLHDWGIRPGDFIGLQNYFELVQDGKFINSLRVTIYLVVMSVPLELIFGMIIAVLLFQNIRGKAVFRLIYFLPFVTSLVAVSLVWGWIFNANFGLLNSLLRMVGLPEPRWLLDPNGILKGLWELLSIQAPYWMQGPSLALVVIAIVTIWHYFGFSVLSYLAGLTNIPKSLEEAAILDGASSWQVFWRITVPLLSPTTYMLSIITTIGAFQSFAVVYTITGVGYATTPSVGEPLGTTQVVVLYIFDVFYRLFKTVMGQRLPRLCL